MKLYLVIWLFLICGPLHATEGTSASLLVMRLCHLSSGFPPFTNAEQDGIWQIKAKKAAQDAEMQIEFYQGPRERCLLEIRSGKADAVFSAENDDRKKYLEFPSLKGNVDPRKSVGQPIFRIYRKKGDKVEWDGKTFSNLGNRAVGIPRGLYPLIILQNMKLRIQTSESGEQALRQLNLGRTAIVVINEEQFHFIVSKLQDFDIEALPIPFTSQPIYIAVSKRYYQDHKKQVDKFWSFLGK